MIQVFQGHGATAKLIIKYSVSRTRCKPPNCSRWSFKQRLKSYGNEFNAKSHWCRSALCNLCLSQLLGHGDWMKPSFKDELVKNAKRLIFMLMFTGSAFKMHYDLAVTNLQSSIRLVYECLFFSIEVIFMDQQTFFLKWSMMSSTCTCFSSNFSQILLQFNELIYII